MDEIDIWRSAKLPIDRHGADARIVAAMHSDEMLERGDVDGQRVSIRTMKAIIAIMEQGLGEMPN